MKSRWLLNLGLLILVAGLALFLYLSPQKKESEVKEVQVSAVKPSSIGKISIEFPAKAPVVMEKRDGHWFLSKPYPARASDAMAAQILAVLNATTTEQLPAGDLARYDLDHPSLRLKLDGEELVFGTHNPLDGRQYVAYKGAVYLLASSYAEAASTQVVELLDKGLLGPSEQIAGFDFSRLEQWEKTGLRLDMENGKWRVSVAAAKPDQNALNEWFDNFWKTLDAISVEPYKPDRKAVYPSFLVKLRDGKTIHFDKLQESPELLLARPDEGMLYHLPQDVGFTLLNPPIGFKPE